MYSFEQKLLYLRESLLFKKSNKKKYQISSTSNAILSIKFHSLFSYLVKSIACLRNIKSKCEVTKTREGKKERKKKEKRNENKGKEEKK